MADELREMVAEQARTNQRLSDLCEKFERFLDYGGVRCAKHDEKIDSLEKDRDFGRKWKISLSVGVAGTLIMMILQAVIRWPLGK